MAPPTRRQGGLTLLEIIAMLAVLAVLGTLTVPSLSARLDRQRALSTAQALVADLHDARFEAAQRNRMLHVAATAGSQWCWTITAAGAPAACEAADAIRTVRHLEHPGVRLLAGDSVTLMPTGDAEARTVAEFGARGGERLRVRVSPLGRASVCAVGGGWKDLAGC